MDVPGLKSGCVLRMHRNRPVVHQQQFCFTSENTATANQPFSGDAKAHDLVVGDVVLIKMGDVAGSSGLRNSTAA